MITTNRFSIVSVKFIAASIAISAVFAMALPTMTHAATYAFVNTSGNIASVTANDWMSAIANALNIHVHSGVILLTSQNSGMVGTSL